MSEKMKTAEELEVGDVLLNPLGMEVNEVHYVLMQKENIMDGSRRYRLFLRRVGDDRIAERVVNHWDWMRVLSLPLEYTPSPEMLEAVKNSVAVMTEIAERFEAAVKEMFEVIKKALEENKEG